MIRELIIREKYIWLVRMYPSERPNIDKLKLLYQGGDKLNDPNLNNPPPPNDPINGGN